MLGSYPHHPAHGTDLEEWLENDALHKPRSHQSTLLVRRCMMPNCREKETAECMLLLALWVRTYPTKSEKVAPANTLSSKWASSKWLDSFWSLHVFLSTINNFNVMQVIKMNYQYINICTIHEYQLIFSCVQCRR